MHLHLHLYLRHLATGIVALSATILLTLSGATSTWAAAPHVAAAPQRALAAASITNKVTLPDTSIDGPALASILPTTPNTATKSVLGWTGADAAHHLNIAKFA